MSDAPEIPGIGEAPAGNRAGREAPAGNRAGRLEGFRAFRERMNARILEQDNLEIRRFFALDDRAYREGALSTPTKELLGLVASTVLRCDDCVSYHLIRCKEEGLTDEQLYEALSVALVVGGSITIPHLRRAAALLDELAAAGADADPG